MKKPTITIMTKRANTAQVRILEAAGYLVKIVLI